MGQAEDITEYVKTLDRLGIEEKLLSSEQITNYVSIYARTGHLFPGSTISALFGHILALQRYSNYGQEVQKLTA